MLANALYTVLLLVSPGHDAQQARPPLLWLSTSTFHANRPGGPSSGSGKPLTLNKPELFVTYALPRLCGFSAGAAFKAVDPESPLGWSVTVIPKLIGIDDVTLGVTWVRERNHKIEARGATDVLIRKGDSVSLDVAQTPEWQHPGCQMTSAELRLEYEPVSSAKASATAGSVISTDMWLVRRLLNGQEQTEQINTRSALNEEVPFYFDDQKSEDLLMSVLGTIRARGRDHGEIALEFSAERQFRSGTAELGRGFTTLFPRHDLLVFKSPQDVISVEFPLSNDSRWKAFGGEQLSIRLRTRRIR